MKAWYSIPILGILIFSLTGCPNQKTPLEIARQLKRSVVLINYKNGEGHGTGFFVPGYKSNCAVLTARHVVSQNKVLQLTTNDTRIWTVNSNDVHPFPNYDLALLTFSPEGKPCPYPVLKLRGYTPQEGQPLYIYGFNNNGYKTFVPGSVNIIRDLEGGYGIAYEATTTGGMSGSPVANLLGEVIAVHGKSHYEMIKSAENNDPLKEKLQSLPLPEDNDQINERGSINLTFSWGIPIKVYLDNVSKIESLKEKNQQKFRDRRDVILPDLLIIAAILTMACGLCITLINFLVHENQN